MVEMFPLRSADAAYNKISAMLSTLGDPFTRIISPKVYLFAFWLLNFGRIIMLYVVVNL